MLIEIPDPIETLFYNRNPLWYKVREEYVKKYPKCSLCGSINDLEVHHILPYHLFPEEELNEANFISLCRRDHFIFGHLLDWKAYNINVVDDVAIMREKIKNRNVS